MSLWKPVELALTGGARLAWPVFQAVNRRFEGKSFQPQWSAAPLMKSRERSSPPLGWPRTTDSLCPSCVRETRARILSGEQSIESLVNQHVGEIPASILERDGKIVIEKTCPIHGTFTDTLAINPDFLKRIESLFPGRDFDAVTDRLHNHGTSSIKHGRGAVLTIDLTNRCNMMCDPCFMDANQVGYVHELTLDEVKQLLDDAVSIKPRRQMTVQFSGGEPTISPIFLDAVRYARTGRLLQRAGGDQRHPLRPGTGVRAAGARGGPSHCLPAVRRRVGAGERAPQGRQPVRREAARDREPVRGRHRRLPRGHDREHRERSPGRADRQVRAAELRQDQLRLVSARLVHRPRRGDLGRGAPRQALHPVAPRGRPEAADRRHRAAARLVPALRLQRAVRCHRPAAGAGRRLGHAEMRLPSGLRRGHGFHGQQEDQGVGAGLGVHQRRSRAAGREGDRRFGARPVADDGADGVERAAQLLAAAARRTAST